MADKNGNGEWKFDLNKWTLEDYIQFSSTEVTKERIVWIGKTIVSTPFGAVNLDDPAERARVPFLAWAEGIKAFNQAVEKAFQ